LFLQLGGYRESLVHQGEEGDYCIRMLDRGWLTRLGTSDPIFHYESPRRDYGRMDFYGRRNAILFVWHHVPVPWFPVQFALTFVGCVTTAIKIRRFKNMTAGICAGYYGCFQQWSERSPVSKRTYLLSRRLRKRGPLPLEDIALEATIRRQAGLASPSRTPPVDE
jgi:hypothetical protein